MMHIQHIPQSTGSFDAGLLPTLELFQVLSHSFLKITNILLCFDVYNERVMCICMYVAKE